MSSITIKREAIDRVDMVITPGMTAGKVWETYHPDVMMNLALYDTSSHMNIVHMLDDGQVSGYLFSDEGIGIDGDGALKWATRHDKLRDFVAGAPTLLKDGRTYIDWGNKYSEYIDGKHKRTVLGFSEKSVTLLCTDDALTIPDLAETCKKFGMLYSVNLDGGGSQHLQDRTKTYKSSARANVSWLCIWLKKGEQIMEIREDLIPKGKKRKGVALRPTTVTIHSTGNAKSTAQNERDWLVNPANTDATGFHVVVDEKEAIMAIPLDEVAYHSGKTAGNTSSIGLEICESGDREKTLDNAVLATAEVLRRLGLGTADLRQHFDWNGKNCPSILRNTGRWAEFVACVKEALEMKKPRTITETTVQSDGVTYDALIVDGTTYAPVRSLAEALGLIVDYDAVTKQVTLRKAAKK